MYKKVIDDAITALIFIGVIIGFVLFIVIPWLWQFLKPLIHSLTA